MGPPPGKRNGQQSRKNCCCKRSLRDQPGNRDINTRPRNVLRSIIICPTFDARHTYTYVCQTLSATFFQNKSLFQKKNNVPLCLGLSLTNTLQYLLGAGICRNNAHRPLTPKLAALAVIPFPSASSSTSLYATPAGMPSSCS